jgi:hypothetical protein
VVSGERYFGTTSTKPSTDAKRDTNLLKFAIISLVAILSFSFVGTALAASPHFIRSSASGPNNQGNLSVNFKIAGLGDNETLNVTASANATAVYACQNNGGNFPSDPKKQEVSGPVSASGQFTSGKNGQITGSLTWLRGWPFSAKA